MLLWATAAQAQGTFVQSAVEGDAQPWVTDAISETSFGATTTAGNVICAAFGLASSSRTVSSVTDDGGNTYALVTGATAEVAGTVEAWIYCSKTTNAANTVTITVSSALAGSGGAVIAEFGNTTASPIEDGIATATTVAATSHDSGNVDVAGQAVLFGGSFRWTPTWTIDADFTAITTTGGALVGYDLVTAGTYSMTNGSSSATAVTLLAAIAANSAGGGCTGGLLLLGAGKCE